MKKLRRFVICFLMAVAALSAVRAVPSFAAQTTMSAAHHCECDENCALSKSACNEQGVCATACNGFMAADITLSLPVVNVGDSLRLPVTALRDGITRPPPLGPPRA
jgi:hypothetical protein